MPLLVLDNGNGKMQYQAPLPAKKLSYCISIYFVPNRLLDFYKKYFVINVVSIFCLLYHIIKIKRLKDFYQCQSFLFIVILFLLCILTFLSNDHYFRIIRLNVSVTKISFMCRHRVKFERSNYHKNRYLDFQTKKYCATFYDFSREICKKRF